MKNLFVVLILLALVTPVFAQNNSENRDAIYYTNVPVERIIPVQTGYIIQYRTGSNILGTIGIPADWLSDAGGSAEIIRLPTASDWPTMSVFYVNGKFSHLRLYVHPAKSHRTWGNIAIGTNVDRFFVDKESFEIQR